MRITEHGRRPDIDRPYEQNLESNAVAATPTSVLAFAPRTAKRPGKTLGKGRHILANATAGLVGSSSAEAPQDAFRALVKSKNKQREGNLETSRAKRPHEEPGPALDNQGDVKKPKTK